MKHKLIENTEKMFLAQLMKDSGGGKHTDVYITLQS